MRDRGFEFEFSVELRFKCEEKGVLYAERRVKNLKLENLR